MGQCFLDWYSSKLPVCELFVIGPRRDKEITPQCKSTHCLAPSSGKLCYEEHISAELTVCLVKYLIYIFVLSGIFDPGIVLSQQGEVTVCGRHQSAGHNLCSAHLHPSLHTSGGLHFPLIPLHHFS